MTNNYDIQIIFIHRNATKYLSLHLRDLGTCTYIRNFKAIILQPIGTCLQNEIKILKSQHMKRD